MIIKNRSIERIFESGNFLYIRRGEVLILPNAVNMIYGRCIYPFRSESDNLGLF